MANAKGILSIPVTDPDFSVRALNHFANLGVKTIGELRGWSAS